jgi:F-type H+-transporting ATPase subunit a
MHLSPDEIIFWQYGVVKINATIVYTWIVMLVLVAGAWLITRRLEIGLQRAHWQNFLEMIVIGMMRQINEIGLESALRYLPFLGTLFLLLFTIAIGTIIPGFEPPTGSLSTTSALALCVFVAVPFFGIREQGLADYLRSYVRPTWIMLPFNVIGELSRTLTLAVRLFGNMMSDAVIVAILLTIAPLLFPVFLSALGLLTGIVQAYIFSILAAVYIAAATRTRESAAPAITET